MTWVVIVIGFKSVLGLNNNNELSIYLTEILIASKDLKGGPFIIKLIILVPVLLQFNTYQIRGVVWIPQNLISN